MDFKIIKQDIDVGAILASIDSFDWFSLSSWYPDINVSPLAGIIPLTHANAGETSGSSLVYNTMYYDKYPAIQEWLKSNGFDMVARSAFMKTKAGGTSPYRADVDSYYQAKTRYCLVLQGTIEFKIKTTDDIIIHRVAPGTMFQYNGMLDHKHNVIGDDDYISFQFDVPAIDVAVE